MTRTTKALYSLAITTALAMTGTTLVAQTITPEPIPPGFHFPTARPIIDYWVRSGNKAAIRGHAWDIWNGMSQNSRVVYNGKRLPIWETWFSPNELFPAKGSFLANLARRSVPSRPFIGPRQFSHVAPRGIQPGSAPSQILSFNKFNLSAGFFITAHPCWSMRPVSPQIFNAW